MRVVEGTVLPPSIVLFVLQSCSRLCACLVLEIFVGILQYDVALKLGLSRSCQGCYCGVSQERSSGEASGGCFGSECNDEAFAG